MSVLLDTNALVWFAAGDRIKDAALLEIARSQSERRLFVSAISAWEVALALQKPNPIRRPNLGGVDAASWFKAVIKSSPARVVPVNAAIAVEAANVTANYRISDPGDCHIVATARARRLTLITRDAALLALAKRDATALSALAC